MILSEYILVLTRGHWPKLLLVLGLAKPIALMSQRRQNVLSKISSENHHPSQGNIVSGPGNMFHLRLRGSVAKYNVLILTSNAFVCALIFAQHFLQLRHGKHNCSLLSQKRLATHDFTLIVAFIYYVSIRC